MRTGKKVPWHFHEYGAIAVKELWMNKESIFGQTCGRPKPLKNPTAVDIEKYFEIGAAIGSVQS